MKWKRARSMIDARHAVLFVFRGLFRSSYAHTTTTLLSSKERRSTNTHLFLLSLCFLKYIPVGRFYFASGSAAFRCHRETKNHLRTSVFSIFLLSCCLPSWCYPRPSPSLCPWMRHQACGWLWSCSPETSIRSGRTSRTWWTDRQLWLARWAFLRSSCQVECFRGKKSLCNSPFWIWLVEHIIHSGSDFELTATVLENVSEGEKEHIVHR